MPVYRGLGPSVVCSPEEERVTHLCSVAASTSWWHCDVTDGKLAPATAGFTPEFLRRLRGSTGLPVELHVLATDPLPVVAEMPAGVVDCFSVHARYLDGPEALRALARDGKPIGLMLEREDPVEILDGLLDAAAGVGVLTVTPGSTGERLDEEQLAHIATLATYRASHAPHLPLLVDGGVKAHNAATLVELGVDGVVSGSGVFATESPPRSAAAIGAAFAAS